jgi:dihydroxyacetone kinase DhaKLM complex PTS-EIIA-like component DhaM
MVGIVVVSHSDKLAELSRAREAAAAAVEADSADAARAHALKLL